MVNNMGQALEMCVHCENKRGCDTCTDLHNWIMEHLDAVPVVRCKDCAVPHNKWTGCPKLLGRIPPDDFYCADGVRKDGE